MQPPPLRLAAVERYLSFGLATVCRIIAFALAVLALGGFLAGA